MGILKNREEMIPVTCAVLKEEDREHFFSDARKRVGGNMDRIASMCGVPVSTVQDWSNGSVLIPYHALQRLAQELSIEQPQISELRREFQAVSQIPQARRPEPEPPPSRAEARRELKKVQEPDRPQRRRERGEGGRKEGRQDKPPQQQQRQPKAPQRQRRGRKDVAPKESAAPRAEKGSSAPKLSDRLAYWTGTVLAAARREETRVVFSADRRMGQNFAGTWAGLTTDLLGVRPTLSMSEDRKVQIAELPSAGLEEFLDRLELKAGSTPESAPAAPRWTWSNPEWKMAFLRGLADAAARFSRAPSVSITGLSPRLRQSAHKILTSLGFTPTDGPQGELLLSGQEAVEKYFDTVGTGNMKMKDQFKAFRGGERAPDDDEDPAAPNEASEPVAQTEVEPPLEAPEASSEAAGDAQDSAAPAAKPEAEVRRRPYRRPRRTAFRGKPGR